MKQKFFIILLLSLFEMIPVGNHVFAQISEGGTPASFSFQEPVVLSKSIKESFYRAPINFDVAKLREEDKISEKDNLPLRTAMIIPTDLSMENSGEWSTLPDGQRIWQLTVKDEGAIATMLYYDTFYIPQGGRLFIYNKDRTHLLGAYTSHTNPENKKFATEFVAGDEITLEYNEPLSKEGQLTMSYLQDDKPDIKISGIGYGYNYLEIYRTGTLLKSDDSYPCQVNINCPEGSDWQDQKKGIARSVIPYGVLSSYLCSGTMVNNTAQDLFPYYLSAAHCFEHSNISLDQMVLYFHYESPGCDDDEPAGTKTVVGAQLLVELPVEGSSDGALLRLNSSIPPDYDIYYNGWDRRNVAATSGVGIHHPKGNIKKISTFTSTVTTYQWHLPDGRIGAHNAQWLVNFIKTSNGFSQSEGGSSGSPLFNQNGLVVGTLSSGSQEADCISGSPSSYGKLWYHWDNENMAGTKKMMEYLDPLNSGVETLEGTYTAGNGIPKVYLQSLTVSPGTLDPVFDASITDYTVTVDSNVSNITVAATAADAGWTVIGNGVHPLKTGYNTIPVVITVRGGSKTYFIKVIRLGSQDGKNDVYVAGTKWNSSGTNPIAQYWKNGVPISLTDGRFYSAANAIAVSGSDVYTAGTERNSLGKSVAKYWKNDAEVTLTNGMQDASVESIFVSDEIVYVSGYEWNTTNKTVAKYWKNGMEVMLTNGVQDAFAGSIFVSDGDVYVAGYENNGSKFIAKYWKNGTEVLLTNGMQDAYAVSIFVLDGDVYVAGNENDGSKQIARFWKNGMPVSLTDGDFYTDAHSIVVSDGSVYVAGEAGNTNRVSVAKYWKNGFATTLSDGTQHAYANSIAVSGNDVYVAGEDGIGNSAQYWKNGTPIVLLDGTNATARQIVLVSSDNTLQSLSVNSGTVVPEFNADITNYTVNVAYDIKSIIISATTADVNATVSGSGQYTLEVGNNTINVVVTAQNGATKTYTVTVIRAAASNNTNLESLTIDAGMLIPTFDPGITNYTVNVAYDIKSIIISATTADVNATVSGTGQYTLEVGSNTLHVVVIAQSGATKTYTIMAIRMTASSDATLRTIMVDHKPANIKEENDKAYVITIDYTTSVFIDASTNHSTATISESNLGEKQVLPGLNTFDIEVIAEDGTTINYCLEIMVEKEIINSIDDKELDLLVIYPNPADEYVTISGLQGKGILSLFDTSGKQFIKRNITSVEERLYVGNLSRGSYIIQITVGKNVKTVKISIQ